MMSTAQSPRGLGVAVRRFLGVPLRRQTYRNLAYLALSFPLGLAYFVVVTTGLSTGVGLAVTLVGVPLLVLTLVGGTIFAGFEAKLVTWLLRIEVNPPDGFGDLGAADIQSLGGLLEATKRLLGTPSMWTSLLLVFLQFVFGLVAFVALVTATTVAGVLLTMPLFYDGAGGTYAVGPYVVDTLREAVAGSALGVLVTLVSLHVLNGLARLGGFTTAVLLGDGSEAASGGA